MQRVLIVSDTLAFDVPVGKDGLIVRIDRRVDEGLSYLVRVPSTKDYWWLPECDLADFSEWASERADDVIAQTMTDYALDTRDQVLFDAYHRREVAP